MEPLVRNMNDTQRSEYVCTVQQRIAELVRERPQDTLKKEWLRKFLDRRVRDGVISSLCLSQRETMTPKNLVP